MNRILGRPGRLLLPLVIAAYAILVNESNALYLLYAILLSRLCSLCAGAALRKATTRIVSGARLTGNYYLALTMGLVGMGITSALCWKSPLQMKLVLAGGLINIAQIASEGLYSIPDSISGMACDALIALCAAAGLLISKGNHLLLVAACGLCLVAAVALSIALRKNPRFTPGAQVIKSVPMALLKTGIPIAAFSAIAADVRPAAVLAALAVFESMETPIRRNAQESHWLNIACMLTGAIGATGAIFFHPAMACASLTVFFLMIFSGALSRRSVALLICLMLAFFCSWEYSACLIDAFPRHSLVALTSIFISGAMSLCIPDYKTVYIRARAQRKKRLG